MRRLALLPLLAPVALALLTEPAAAQAPDTSGRVVVVEIDGSIDGVQADYLRESVTDAEGDGSTVVIQLDSAGTLDEDAVALAERIHAATVPVVVWVGPSPAQAKGAALLFMYAASLGAVAPGAGVGPLEPLDLVDAAKAKIIEDYPDDKYSPSSLLLGFTTGQRPLHLQVSCAETPLVKIITLYEPDEREWTDYEQRK